MALLHPASVSDYLSPMMISGCVMLVLSYERSGTEGFP
jgi:hypothetical protein